MNSITHHFFTIDTLQFSKRLQKAGMSKEVSEELAEAIKDSATQSVDGLAKTQDILDIRKDILIVKKDISDVKNELELKMEMLKKDIILKLGSLMIVGISILAALIKL